MVVGAVDTVDNRRRCCSARASSCDSAVGGRRSVVGSGVDGSGAPTSSTQAGRELSAGKGRSSTVVHSDVWTTVVLALRLGVAMGIGCGEGHLGRPHGYPQPVDKRRQVRRSAHRSRRGHAVHTAVDGSVDGCARFQEDVILPVHKGVCGSWHRCAARPASRASSLGGGAVRGCRTERRNARRKHRRRA